MNETLTKFVATLKRKSSGSSLQAIQQVGKKLGILFPEDYTELVLVVNGCAGLVGKNAYLVMWPIEEIESFNEEIGMHKYALGLLAFADNGGGAWYAFDTRSSKIAIVDIPMIGSGLDDAIVCGHTFTEFLEYLYNYE
jgi:hypothetical protein